MEVSVIARFVYQNIKLNWLPIATQISQQMQRKEILYDIWRNLCFLLLALNSNPLKCKISDVIDLARDINHQRRKKEYIAKCNSSSSSIKMVV